MLEFLKEYWTIVVCVILIIVVIVLLIVFRDKPESNQDANSEPKESKDTQEINDANTKAPEEPTAKPQQDEIAPKVEDEPKVEEKQEEPKAKKQVTKKKVEKKEEPKFEEQKAEDGNDEDKAKTQKYMVTYDKEHKDWVVKKTGAQKASKRCKTKKEAMEVVTKLANSQDLNVSVKKKDGKFQKRENASK